jgi:hypothetical protein
VSTEGNSLSDWERFTRARLDILQNKQLDGNRSDQEVCTANGLLLNRYWEIVLRNDQPASDLEYTLILEFLSPRGFVTPDRRRYSLFKLNFRAALVEAFESGQTWIKSPNVAPEVIGSVAVQTSVESFDLSHISIGVPVEGERKRASNDFVIVCPRDAIKWLIGNPKRDYLISANLRAIVSGHKPTSEKALLNVSPSALLSFLKEIADGKKTEAKMRQLAKEHFVGKTVPERQLREALRRLPPEKKRKPGDTNRTLRKRKDNPAA